MTTYYNPIKVSMTKRPSHTNWGQVIGWILTFTIALVIALALLAAMTTSSADSSPAYRTVKVPTSACMTDDSDNCYYDAGARGNHLGCSYWSIDGKVRYLDPRVNRMTRAQKVRHCTSDAR